MTDNQLWLVQFQEFWQNYPRRVAVGAARKAYLKWRGKGVSHQEIMDGLLRFKAANGDREAIFTPHASTWLNGERWNDEYPELEAKKDTVMEKLQEELRGTKH